MTTGKEHNTKHNVYHDTINPTLATFMFYMELIEPRRNGIDVYLMYKRLSRPKGTRQKSQESSHMSL
jgi:hypothetical protein